MSAPTTTRALHAVPACPPWCVAHQQSDQDVVHLSDRCQLAELALHLVRIDGTDEPVIMLEVDEDGQWADALGDALSLDAAERLAQALLEVVRAGRVYVQVVNSTEQSRSSEPQDNQSHRDQAAAGLEYCERCGHTFHPDSSPNLVLCWQCSEAECDPPEPWQQLDLWRTR